MRLAYIRLTLSLMVRCVCASLLFINTAIASDSERNILKILTWPDYIDPMLVKSFEERFQASVEFTYFETDEHRDEILIEQDGKGFDLVLVSSVSLPNYVRQDWLKPVQVGLIETPPTVSATCSHIDDSLSAYVVPYFWGTVGIAYRSDLVDVPPTHWMDLYAPDPEHRGHILMIGDSTELLGMAVIAGGNPMSSNSSSVWESAAQLAFQQKPFVKRYGYMSLTESAEIVASDDIHMAQIYNGDALTLKEYNDNIEYVQPAEGAGLWVDFWAVMSSSVNDRLSYGFLSVVNEPDMAAKNAEYIYLATCNQDAYPLLSSVFLEEDIIYPPADVMDKLQYYPVHSPRLSARINSYYSQIVDGD